jgi:hypothetical protein
MEKPETVDAGSGSVSPKVWVFNDDWYSSPCTLLNCKNLYFALDNSLNVLHISILDTMCIPKGLFV